MWQAPSQRGRALASVRKREKDRNRKPFHLKRVTAEIKVLSSPASQPTITQARVLLNDLNPKGMGLFSATPLMVGQEVAITLEQPQRIYMRGRIIWCQEYDVDSHIMSSHSFSYRMGIQFIFESAEDEKAVKDFCEQLNRDVIFQQQAA
jgi:hypothetical protein